MIFEYIGAITSNERLLDMIEATIFLLFFSMTLYLFIYAVYSTTRRKDVYPMAKKQYRMAILFPTHQCSEVLKSSLESFINQDYPTDKFDIFVISDYIEDTFYNNLIASGIKYISLDDDENTKIQALQKAITLIDGKGLSYDTVVILDTDNHVDPDFLQKLNDAFYSGCSAIQTHRIAKNIKRSIAVLDAVSEEINNSIFRKGHTHLGFSSALIGSGMAFEYSLFREHIFLAGDSSVDKQLELGLLKDNIYIEYLENVYTYDDKVKKNSSFYKQRRRWMASQLSSLLNGLSDLPSAIINGHWDYCDKLIQWTIPPRILLFGYITLIASFVTTYSLIESIKWWALLFMLCLTFSIAIPGYLVNRRLTKAIIGLPLIFVMMLLGFFRFWGASKEMVNYKKSKRKSKI